MRREGETELAGRESKHQTMPSWKAADDKYGAK